MQPIPAEWLTNLTRHITNPSGKWADFNSVNKLYECLNQWTANGMVRKEDIPPKPKPSDYPDLTSPGEIT